MLWVVVEVEIVSEVITNQRRVGEIGQNLEADLDPEVVLTGKESDTHGGAEEKGTGKGGEGTKKGKQGEGIGIALPRFPKKILEEAAHPDLTHQTQGARPSVKTQEQILLKMYQVQHE